MEHDFTTHVNRRGQGSSKWESMLRDCPAAGEDVVPLSVADMEFENPPEVRRALHALVDSAVLGYTEPTRRFFDACVSWQERRHAWSPRKEWIVTSSGVVPAFFNAVRSLTREGGGVIIQPPVYYPFKMAVEASGRTLVENPLILEGGRFVMDFDDLENKAADPANTMLILCSPHNPVGRVWSAEELRRLVDICVVNDVLIVSDEIHDDLIMPGYEHTTIMRVMRPDEYDHVIVCTAPSKTFNLAGCQASVIYVPDEGVRTRFSEGFRRLAQFSLNIFGYTATIAAYEECAAWLDELIGVVRGNYELLSNWVARRHPELVAYPLEGTYLAWVDFRAWGLGSKELESFMKGEARLWLDEGYVFGESGAGFERINLACPADVLVTSLDRLDAAASRRGLGTTTGRGRA